jgi:AraC-like DNA-binding protein
MPGSGTRTFLEPDDYEASLRQALIDPIITCRGKFAARLTWAELHQLRVLRCQEDFPRVAFISLASGAAFVTFPSQTGPSPVWRGTELQAGDIMFHSHGERFHQSTFASTVWDVIAFKRLHLERYGRALSGKPFSPPDGKILHPAPRDAARLRRLHGQICRLAETKPKMLLHSEVAHAIEQDLIQALVSCLTAVGVRSEGLAKRHHAKIMIRCEEVLAEHLGERLHMAELCELIGVTDRTLRICCTEFLGLSPTRYVLLRRLRQVRIALRDAAPDTATVEELARGCGFAEQGRFASIYRAVFGEPPSTTLQRAPGEVRRSVNSLFLHS